MSSETIKEANSPAYRNAATRRQAGPLTIVRDLAGGTPRLREAGTTYLPMEAGESPTAYSVRLKRSLLFNTFVKVREGLVGMALKRNPELDTDVPLLIKEHVEDIDLAGTHLDVFAKELFRDVIQDGHALILIDMPTPIKPGTPGTTRADENGRRPYWVKYRKDQAVNWKSDRVDGSTILTQISLEDCATESDGEYGEKEVTRNLVFKLPKLAEKTPSQPAIYGPMEWALYEKRIVDGKEQMVPVAGDVTKLTRIPVVPIYSRKTGFLESEPPLIDLAYLNIGHWQQWSDLNCQQRMLVPILHLKGELITPPVAEGTQKPEIKVGPGAVVQTDKDGDVKYVSADASATQAISDSLSSLEQRMSAVGLSVISPKPSQPAQAATATEKVMDQDERMSELASWLRNLKDGIESGFKIHASYIGLPDGGSIILGFDEPEDTEPVMAIDAPKSGTMPGVMNGGVQ